MDAVTAARLASFSALPTARRIVAAAPKLNAPSIPFRVSSSTTPPAYNPSVNAITPICMYVKVPLIKFIRTYFLSFCNIACTKYVHFAMLVALLDKQQASPKT
jgi:hypothetical protein